MVMDLIAGRVFGLVTARDARCLWADGTLYICKSPTDIVTFQTDKPVKRGGVYKATSGEATISMQTPGCGSCRRRVLASPIGQMSAADIIASMQGLDAVIDGGSISETVAILDA